MMADLRAGISGTFENTRYTTRMVQYTEIEVNTFNPKGGARECKTGLMDKLPLTLLNPLGAITPLLYIPVHQFRQDHPRN
jgi:hypothetical protein